MRMCLKPGAHKKLEQLPKLPLATYVPGLHATQVEKLRGRLPAEQNEQALSEVAVGGLLSMLAA